MEPQIRSRFEALEREVKKTDAWGKNLVHDFAALQKKVTALTKRVTVLEKSKKKG